MKQKMRVVCAMIVLMLSCRTGLRVQDSTVAATEEYQNFISYYLPKTELKIRIPIEKTELKKGLIDKLQDPEKTEITAVLFQRYGWELLKTDEDTYSLGEKIHFIPMTVPDPKKHFTIAYKKARSLGQTSGLTFNKDGIISSGEFSQEDKTYEYVTKGVELLASSAGKLFGLGKSVIDPAVITGTSIEAKRIETLMKELDDLADAKSSLIKSPTAGVATTDPTKYRLELIDKRISRIKQEIFGHYKKTIINISLIYEPGAIIGNIPLLQIDPKNGFVIPGLNDNDPITSTLNGWVANSQVTAAYKVLTLFVEKSYEPAIPKNNFVNSKNFGQHFLVYNIPAKYNVQLRFDGKPLKSFANPDDEKGSDLFEIYFPQKGSMAALPYDFKDMKIVFYEDIGAIKEIKYNKAVALDATGVAMGVAALDSIISLRTKIKESKKEDPVEDDTEEVKEQVIRLIIQKDSTSKN